MEKERKKKRIKVFKWGKRRREETAEGGTREGRNEERRERGREGLCLMGILG